MFTEIRGSVVSYEMIGQGVPIIILHGLGEDRTMMKGFMEPMFSDNDAYQRVYLDLPGMGESIVSSELKSSDDMLQVVLDFIEQVIPGEPFLLAGLSYGGYLVRGVAHRLPHHMKGMLLICPVIYPFERQLEEHLVRKKDENFLNSLAETDRNEFLSYAVVQTPYVYERFQNEVIPGTLAGDRLFLKSEFRTKHYGFTFDPDEHAERVHAPILIIAGRQDSSVGFKDAMGIAVQYPKATFAVLDFAGHLIQLEQPEIVEAMTKEWLRRCGETIEIA